MSKLYNRMQGTASRLIGKYGTTATFTRTIQGEYNYGTGEHDGGETVIWTAKVVKAGLSKEFLNDSRLEVGDMQITVDCKGQTYIPQLGDSVTFANGETWSVLVDMPIEPAGMIVVYKGIIRRG